MCYVNNNLSNRLGNTFVDSSTCSNLNDLDTGIYNVNNYDGKITNVPFPGGSFMCVVAKQGDLYKYLLASVEGSLATKSLINGSWSSWAYYALKSDLEAVKSKQINRYTSAENNTDAVLSSYENKEGNFILQFTSNDTTGAIPTLTGSHLFIIEHFMVGNDVNAAIERAYSTKGKLIAWRFKQWWDKTWTAWEN